MRADFLALTFAAGMSSAHAGPAEDAAFIAEQHLTLDLYQEAEADFRDVALLGLGPTFERLGAELVDPDGFLDLWSGDFDAGFVATATDAYQELASEDELAALAAFYATEIGQAFLATGVLEDRAAHPVALRVHRRFVAYLDYRLTTILGQGLTIGRLVDLVGRPDVFAFEDDAQRARAIQLILED